MPEPQLHFGPYAPPRFRLGEVVSCERFADVVIVGISAGRIQWPLGRRAGARGNASLVLFGDLVRAVRQETGVAVRYWFGAGTVAVDAMRKALGVKGSTPGTTKTYRENCERPVMKAALAKAWSKAQDPVRREKIAAAKRGVKRSAATVRKMSEVRKGIRPTAEARRKMSETQRRLGTRPPWLNPAWSDEEIAAVRELSIAEAASKTGRSVSAVKNKRLELELPDARTREQRKKFGRSM